MHIIPLRINLGMWLVYILITVAGCQGNQSQGYDEDVHEAATPGSPEEQYYNIIFNEAEDKVFRNVMLDMDQDTVKSIEADFDLALSEEEAGYLQYEQDLLVDTVRGSDYVELKYIFDDADRLDIITVNYYIQDSSMTNSLFDHLYHEFSEDYGDFYIDSDGYTVWESSYYRSDSTNVAYDIAIRKFIQLNDPGITIELMRFGSM